MRHAIAALLLATIGNIVAEAATINWTNTAGGNWNAPANWSPNQVPGSTDTAVIAASGTYTLAFNASATIAGLTIGGASGTQTFSLFGNMLTLNGLATINSSGAFNLSGGTLAGNNGVIAGILNWTSGSIGSGTLTVATNGVLVLAGNNGTGYNLTGALTNAGTVRLVSGNLSVYYSGTSYLINQPGGLVDIQADVSIIQGASTGHLINAGTVRKSGGMGTSRINVDFLNSGTLDVQTGTVNVNYGGSSASTGAFQSENGATLAFVNSFSVNSGATFTGEGTNIITGGAFTLDGLVTISNLTLAGGSLRGGSNGVIAGLLTWTGGSLADGGPLTMATNGVLVLAGNNGTGYNLTGALTNAGTVRLVSGNLSVYYSGTSYLINQPGGLVDIQADVSIIQGASTGHLINAGTVRKSGGMGTSRINVDFLNSGTLDVQTGTVNVNYGGSSASTGAFQSENGATLAFVNSFSVNSGATFTGEGTNIITGGAFTLDGLVTISNLTLAGGSLRGGSNGVIAGLLTWTGGSLADGGPLTMATNGVLVLAGNNGTGYNLTGALTNAGTVRLVSGNLSVYYSGTSYLINQPGGLVDIQADVSIIQGASTGHLINAGTVRKSGGMGTSRINVDFLNSGTLDVQTGTVNVNYGGSSASTGAFQSENGATLAFVNSFSVNSGATFTGEGTNIITGGAFTLDGLVTISNLTLAGGSLRGGSNGVIAGLLTWTGGSLADGGPLTMATNGVLVLAGNNGTGYNLTGALTNAGTVRLVSGNLSVYYSGTSYLINQPGGLVDIQADVSIIQGASTGHLINAGTVRKSGGTGTSRINVDFLNSGTLDVQSGIVSLSGSYNLTNGTLNFGISNTLNYGKINLSGSPATLAGSVSANLNDGFVPVTGNSFSVLTYGSRSGSFTDFILPFAVAWQTNYGSTTFTLTVLNVRPALVAIPDQIVNELETLTVTNSASDPDAGQKLTYALVSRPSGMTINSTSGLIAWTPPQSNSPSTNTVLVSVSDNATTPLITTNSFTVFVREVNVAPTLPTLSTQTVYEFHLLTVTNTATNFNIHATNVGYGLVNPPAGMSIDSSGVIRWTPDQTQVGTNTITTVVTNLDAFDAVNPNLTATNSFTVMVYEINYAPTISLPGSQIVNELTLMTVTCGATEASSHRDITGWGLQVAPDGASIDTSGVISWTPRQDQCPGVYSFQVFVSNNNPYDPVNPHLTGSASFNVTVREVNVAPSLPTILTQIVNELTLLTVTNTATNANSHATITGYTLVNPPGNMVINASGLITWTPTEAQGPFTNIITTVVTNSDSFDTVNPHLTATNSFTVIVNEVNFAPVLGALNDFTINPGQTISFTATATDSDIPANTLTFGLASAPTGAGINATSGVFNWRPTTAQANTTNVIQVQVTDSNPSAVNAQHLSDTKSFTVILNPLSPVVLTPISYTNGQFKLQVSGTTGPDYIISTSGTLTNWIDIATNLSPAMPFQYTDTNATDRQRFYRVLVMP